MRGNVKGKNRSEVLWKVSIDFLEVARRGINKKSKVSMEKKNVEEVKPEGRHAEERDELEKAGLNTLRHI